MRFGADALYERLALPSAAGSRAAARLGIPHLIDLDKPLLAESRRGRPDQGGSDGTARLEREVLARAERVFTVSSPLAMHALRCGARRVEVFPGAVAIERHPHRRRTCERPVAVFAGRVRPWHDIETVAAAWRLLGEAAPVLVIAGDAGEASELLEGVGAVLLGPIPHRQVPAVLAEADIGLAPYAREAPIHLSPLKLFEYMGAGLASVAGELPATHELVSAEQVLLVPRGDPEALAAAVAGLAVDEPRRDRQGRTARALVAGAHTWRHRARRLMQHVAAPVTRDEPPEPVRDEEPRVRSRPAPRLERLPVPADPALPQMAQVLDTDVMAEVLARSLGENAEPLRRAGVRPLLQAGDQPGRPLRRGRRRRPAPRHGDDRPQRPRRAGAEVRERGARRHGRRAGSRRAAAVIRARSGGARPVAPARPLPVGARRAAGAPRPAAARRGGPHERARRGADAARLQAAEARGRTAERARAQVLRDPLELRRGRDRPRGGGRCAGRDARLRGEPARAVRDGAVARGRGEDRVPGRCRRRGGRDPRAPPRRKSREAARVPAGRAARHRGGLGGAGGTARARAAPAPAGRCWAGSRPRCRPISTWSPRTATSTRGASCAAPTAS